MMDDLLKSKKQLVIELHELRREVSELRTVPPKAVEVGLQKTFQGLSPHRDERHKLKAARQELESSQRKYMRLFDFAPIGYFIIDVNTAIRGINLKGAEMIGYDRSYLIGKSMLLYVVTASREALVLHLLGMFEGIRSSVEVTLVSRSGRRFPVIFKSEGFHNNPEMCLWAAIDISDRKRVEEALNESNRNLEEALTKLQEVQQQVIQQERLSALGQMASGIAHDFNNALTPILGFCEMLLGPPKNLANIEKVTQYLQRIRTATQDAASIVRRLFEFYRLRKSNEIFDAVNLNQLIEEVISLTQPRWKDQANSKGITIRIEKVLAPNMPSVAGVEAELREMVTNLILNAVDAMPEGGTIMFRTRTAGNRVVLEICDTGVGMTKAVQQRCIEPFFTTKGEHGTGLGLSIVFGIVQRHEGQLEIESQPAEGTEIFIHLPIHTQRTSQKSDAEVDLKPSRSKRVLVIDDEPLVREIVTEYLTINGHTIETAADGREGLEKFRAGTFDLVVTDRGMPGMNGDQLAIAIKQIAPDLPIIMLTGFGDLMQASGEKPTGVDAVVGKPVTLGAFQEALAELARV